MKHGHDETDAEILRMLVEDGRVPYTEIAEEVGMSPPSVIDRVDRLRETGVIEGFEARIDRSVLGGDRLLVRFGTRPDETGEAVAQVAEDDRVEEIYTAADGTVTAVANAQPDEARELVSGVRVDDFTVDIIVDELHQPSVSSPSFAPDCVECDKTVDGDGVSTRVAGDLYHFCCTSCESAFRERYDALAE